MVVKEDGLRMLCTPRSVKDHIDVDHNACICSGQLHSPVVAGTDVRFASMSCDVLIDGM